MSKIRFIEYIPSRGLLLQVHSAVGIKAYSFSVANSAFLANSTGVPIGTIIRTICLWYHRTTRQMSENLDVAHAFHALLPGRFPTAFRSEITMGLSPCAGKESSRSPVFSTSPLNSPN